MKRSRVRGDGGRAARLVLVPGVAVLLLRIEIGLRRTSVVDLACRMGVPLATHPTPVGERAEPELTARERRRARVVQNLVARVYGRDRGCLRSALAVGHILRAHAPLLHLGVDQSTGSLTAHAWLEVGGFRVGQPGRHAPLAFLP